MILNVYNFVIHIDESKKIKVVVAKAITST